MKKNIVVLDGFSLNPGDLSWESISQLGNLSLYPKSKYSQILERANNAEIIITNKVVMDKEIIDQLPKLKYIAVSATGYNNVDTVYANKCGILCSNVRGYGSQSVAQHVFALILSFTNRVSEHHKSILNGDWERKNVFSYWNYPLIELANKNLGIIGFGKIGQQTAKIAEGFGMNVLVLHPQKIDAVLLEGKNIFQVSKNELLQNSDFISIHAPLTKDTFHLIDNVAIGKMKESSFLINTSRGDLIDEEALIDALKKNKISGAGLDVFNKEPLPKNHPLTQLTNCILTPHNAWGSLASRKRMMQILYANINSYLEGKPENLI